MTDKSIYQDKLLRREILLKAKTESGLELSDEDVHMCILTMQRKGVSYFHDHIWANKRYDRHTKTNKIVWTLSADGRRAIAHQQGLAGMDLITFEENEDGSPKLARVRVYRRNEHGGVDEYWGEARFDEYVERKRDGEIQQQWQRRPFGQLAKCAEMQALRRAFPEMDFDATESAPAEPVVPDKVSDATTEKISVPSGIESEAKPAPKPEVSGSPEHKAKVKEVLDETEKNVGIDVLKRDALPLFKVWSERFNNGNSVSWKCAYKMLTGVVIEEGVDMEAKDYEILISSFIEALEKKEETND